MRKNRHARGDALARMIFEKPLAELNPSERAQLNFLRTLPLSATEDGLKEQTDVTASESGDVTFH
jgi:hypothetical protein